MRKKTKRFLAQLRSAQLDPARQETAPRTSHFLQKFWQLLLKLKSRLEHSHAHPGFPWVRFECQSPFSNITRYRFLFQIWAKSELSKNSGDYKILGFPEKRIPFIIVHEFSIQINDLEHRSMKNVNLHDFSMQRVIAKCPHGLADSSLIFQVTFFYEQLRHLEHEQSNTNLGN